MSQAVVALQQAQVQQQAQQAAMLQSLLAQQQALVGKQGGKGRGV